MTARFDETVERSWERFEQQLVADLHRRPEGHRLWVAPGEKGEGAWFLAILPHDGVVSAELSGNDFLPEGWRLDSEQQRALAALGWEEPHAGVDEEPECPANWGCQVTYAELPVLASMTVGALRQVLGVVHPRFLGGDLAAGLVPDDTEDTDDTEDDEGEQETEQLVAFPESVDELRDLVARVLRPRTTSLQPDEDGDFCLLPESGAWVVVHPDEDAPVVRVWGIAVRDVDDDEQARREVNVLNRRLSMTKAYLDGDTVIVELDVSACPLVGAHLIDAVERLMHALESHAQDLAERLDATVATVLAPSDGPA